VEEPVAVVEAPVPLDALELTRLSIAEPPEVPLAPVRFPPKFEPAPTAPRDVPTELPEEAPEPPPEPPPTACANAKLELRANTEASAAVAGFMLSPSGSGTADNSRNNWIVPEHDRKLLTFSKVLQQTSRECQAFASARIKPFGSEAKCRAIIRVPKNRWPEMAGIR
jgi:hypothetical protein